MTDFYFNTDELILTQSEQKIIDYIYQNISVIPFLSINQLANDLDISIATISRFVRHVGFDNFKGLKAAIIEHKDFTTPAGKLHRTLSQDGEATIFNLFLSQEAYLAKTRENLSQDEVVKAVKRIAQSKTIYFFGKGAASGLAELFAFRLRRFGKQTILINSSGSELFEDLVNIKKEDLVILFGFHKIPLEAKIILEHKKEIGYCTLLFSDKIYYSNSQQCGDINLYVYRGEVKEYHSMTTLTALIDCIVVLVAKELGNYSTESLSNLYELKEKFSKDIPR